MSWPNARSVRIEVQDVARHAHEALMEYNHHRRVFGALDEVAAELDKLATRLKEVEDDED